MYISFISKNLSISLLSFLIISKSKKDFTVELFQYSFYLIEVINYNIYIAFLSTK